MKHSYKLTLILITAAAIFGFTHSVWAQSKLIVEWETSPNSGEPRVNALRDAIIADVPRPADRVYVLRRGGYYHITDVIENPDFHLHIVGQDPEDLAPGEIDYGKAIIQKVARADGSAPDGTMFRAGDDFTLENVWVMGITSQGSLSTYEPIQLLGDGERFTFDRVVFDRNDWHHIGANGPNSDFFFTNCIWRNQFGLTQIWEGRGVRFNAGADTVVFENNTMFNVGSIPIQAESATPVNYMRVNHNTFVNVGRNFGGAFWKTFYMTNNVWVNYQWHGRYIPDINPNDIDPRGSFFNINSLPAGTGTNSSRKIAIANNSWWRDPAFEAWYPSANIQPVPFLNDTTQGWFDAYPNMLLQGNYADVNPGVKTYPLNTPGVLDSMKAHIVHLYGGGGAAPRYWWDPSRDFDLIFDGVYPDTAINFSYSNAALLTGATDGLPVGDLNWFPTAKATWEANKAQYVKAIEDLVSAPTVTHEAGVEVESGTLANGAEVVGYNYPVVIRLQEGPTITWTYNAPAAGTYTLRFNYNLSMGAPKGQKIHINDAPYTAGDPDVMFEGAANTWLTRDLDVTLQAGTNKIQIVKSWGWMYFGNLQILQGGTSLATLNTVEAVLVGDVRFEKLNASDPSPPSGWYYVSLPSANSSVTLAYNSASGGGYAITLTYSAEAVQQLRILVNGAEATTLGLAATAGDWTDLTVEGLSLNAGANQIEFRAVGGGLSIDKIDFYTVTTGVAGPKELPEGYALWQNYPNPFNPTTNINFALGKPSQVKLTVYNVLGQKVLTLIDTRMSAGTHTVQFDARKFSTGVYFYRLEAGDFVFEKRMLFIK